MLTSGVGDATPELGVDWMGPAEPLPEGVSLGVDSIGKDGDTTGSDEVGVIPGVAEGVICTGKTVTSYTLSLYSPPHVWL